MSSKKPLCRDTSPVVNSWCETGYRGPAHKGCAVSPPGSQVFVREEVSPAGGFALKKRQRYGFRVCYIFYVLF